ncbi:MAG: type II toxin-antitoxin system prevent-host-death family antitoxin [Halioglobus sp.]|nr:type II toxin-antitoxin system prevent-host-death family antitoxin [Halioglobus sp.]
MSTVSVTELKARLSEYLREIKRGGEVRVLERGIPIARLTGIENTIESLPEEVARRRRRLIASGVLAPGAGKLDPLPPMEIDSGLGDALAEEREDRI